MFNLSTLDLNILKKFSANIPYFKYTIDKKKHIIYISIYKDNIWQQVTIRYFNGDNINALRGYQFDFIWIDELLKFTKAFALMEQVNLCLRKGISKCIITTTPVQHDSLIVQLCKLYKVYITHGTSHDNISLSNTFTTYIKNCEDKEIINREIEANIINKRLWVSSSFIYIDDEPEYYIYRLGLDMAITTGRVGIVVIGIYKNRIYVLESYVANSLNWIEYIKEISNKYDPLEILYETNQGGNLIESLLHFHNIRCAIYGVYIHQHKKSRHNDLFLYYSMKLIYHTKNVQSLEKEMLEYKYYDSIDALWCCLYNINKYLYDI